MNEKPSVKKVLSSDNYIISDLKKLEKDEISFTAKNEITKEKWSFKDSKTNIQKIIDELYGND